MLRIFGIAFSYNPFAKKSDNVCALSLFFKYYTVRDIYLYQIPTRTFTCLPPFSSP